MMFSGGAGRSGTWESGSGRRILLRCDRGDSQQKKKTDERDLGRTYESFAALSRRFT